MKLSVRILAMVLILTASRSFADSEDFFTKVIGGVEASVGEFPFIVSLQDSQGHFCGGSLIRKNWVLTAAHCTGITISKVVIGLRDLNDARNTETIPPKRVIAHPKYNAETTDYDFALIELSQDSHFQPIELNTAKIGSPTNRLRVNATVAGWGTTKENPLTWPTRLQKVSVPVVPNDSCNRSYKGVITDRMLCAGFSKGGKDSCQGDSGGPLVATTKNSQPYLIGVVSWGEGCAHANHPGVYSRVSEAVSWIIQVTRENTLRH